MRGQALAGSSDYAKDNQGSRFVFYSKKLGKRLIIVKSLHQSIKIFVKLDLFTNVLVVLFQLFSAEHKVSDTEEKCYFGFDSGKKC